MHFLRPILPLLLASAATLWAAEQDNTRSQPAADVVFREPFTLFLPVNPREYYKEDFGRTPYVDVSGEVYLFKDDEFGITVDIQDNVIRGIKYQKDLKKADVVFKFTQSKPDADKPTDEKGTMKLAIHNHLEKPLKMDALMTIPSQQGIFETQLQPIGPGYASYETWPHPVTQLVIRNIRIEK